MFKTKGDLVARARVDAERWRRYNDAYMAWAATQEAEVYFSDWVRLALDRQADRDLGDTLPASEVGGSKAPMGR